jgi:hypothetical protein
MEKGLLGRFSADFTKEIDNYWMSNDSFVHKFAEEDYDHIHSMPFSGDSRFYAFATGYHTRIQGRQ